MYQNAVHLESQGSGKTSGIQLHLASQCFGKTFLTMCIRMHYTWQVLGFGKTSGIHLLQCVPEGITLGKTSDINLLSCVPDFITSGKSRFGKTSGIHLLQCVPEWIALGKSRFW